MILHHLPFQVSGNFQFSTNGVANEAGTLDWSHTVNRMIFGEIVLETLANQVPGSFDPLKGAYGRCIIYFLGVNWY